MHCAIVAGGMGTRLRSVTGDLPKPMVPLLGSPLLERLIGTCRQFGITDIHLMLGYRPESIREYFGDGSALGVNLTYWVEDEPLGSAGCMRPLASVIEGDVLVLYGDVFLDMDLNRFIAFNRASQADATLAVHPNDHPLDSDLVEVEDDRVVAFHRKPHPPGVFYANLASAAAYVVSKPLLDAIPEGPSDFIRDIFSAALASGKFLAAYNTPEYIKDIGTPERYRRVEADLQKGKPARCNLIHRRKAIFLDRDGTVNVLVPLLSRIEDLELYPGVGDAI